MGDQFEVAGLGRDAYESGSQEALSAMDEYLESLRDEYEELLWVVLPTAGMADDRLVTVANKTFVVVGNKTYATVSGSQKTVMMLKEALPDDAVAAGPAAKAAKADTRSRWLNESYKTIVSHKKAMEWAEANDQTGAVQNTYVETGRTADYVELYCAANKCHVRYFANRAEFKKDGGNGKWEWVANGHWGDPTVVADAVK